jgi:plasmid stabilization system protein ParE
MAVKALELHPAALEELRSAVVWYRERNQSAAINFAAELDRAIDLVASSPERWPRGEHGTRKFVLQRFPFAIVYREKEDVIQVLAVAHGHRRPGYWKARL